MEGEGFEPSKAEPPDLQSGPFNRSGTPPYKNRAMDFPLLNNYCQQNADLFIKTFSQFYILLFGLLIIFIVLITFVPSVLDISVILSK